MVLDCGNGAFNGAEECDDSNTVDSDGCTDCIIDDGYNCIGFPSICEP